MRRNLLTQEAEGTLGEFLLAAINDHRALLVLLGVGLFVRLILLWGFAGTGMEIEDERHYHEIATSLVQGEGFALGGRLTSIRPPLYPFLLAGVGAVAGMDDLQAVRAVQIVLSLINVVLIYALGTRVYSQRVGLIGAGIFCFYPTLVTYDFLILTEVLFTLLLTLAVFGCIALFERGTTISAAGTGLALGLAALTRSVLWPFPLVLCPLVCLFSPGPVVRRLGLAAVVLIAYGATVMPWAVRNTELQQVPVIVDTMGGINLRLGNFEHTPHVRMWDGVAMTGEESWSYALRVEHPDAPDWTEGQREKWAQRKAIEFMLANPLLTLQRSVIKFADFWGLEREILAALQRGNYSLSREATTATAVLITVAYPLVICLAVLGAFFNPPASWRTHVVLLLFIGFLCAIHMIVYGHSRYHVPLVAIMSVYAAAALCERSWLRLGESLTKAAAPVAVLLGLTVIWVNQAWLDAERIRALVSVLR